MNPSHLSARAQALALLETVLVARRTCDDAWAAQPLTGSEADQKFARHLLLSVLRHRGQLEVLIRRQLEKPLPAKRHRVELALYLGAAQLLLLQTPPHAAIHETVALIKYGPDRGFAGLVNAVLQRLAQARPALPAVETNIPPWIGARWKQCYGGQALASIAEMAASRPPLDIASKTPLANALALDRLMQRLPPDHPPVEQLPGYEAGEFFVQDLAASYPARLLGDVRGQRVLDLCAAPGGKTAQLLWAGAEVTALDRSPARLLVLQENMARLKHAVDTITADILTWEPKEPYDAILLDAPCTATGTWRRHPEVLALLTPESIAERAALQRQLLARAWNWVKPGGRLVYCVCSLEREEGEAQADWFLNTHADAAPLAIGAELDIHPPAITESHQLRTLPSMRATQGGMDGFFAAGFRKQD